MGRTGRKSSLVLLCCATLLLISTSVVSGVLDESIREWGRFGGRLKSLPVEENQVVDVKVVESDETRPVENGFFEKARSFLSGAFWSGSPYAAAESIVEDSVPTGGKSERPEGRTRVGKRHAAGRHRGPKGSHWDRIRDMIRNHPKRIADAGIASTESLPEEVVPASDFQSKIAGIVSKVLQEYHEQNPEPEPVSTCTGSLEHEVRSFVKLVKLALREQLCNGDVATKEERSFCNRFDQHRTMVVLEALSRTDVNPVHVAWRKLSTTPNCSTVHPRSDFLGSLKTMEGLARNSKVHELRKLEHGQHGVAQRHWWHRMMNKYRQVKSHHMKDAPHDRKGRHVAKDEGAHEKTGYGKHLSRESKEEVHVHEKRSRHQEPKGEGHVHDKRSRHEEPKGEGHVHDKRSRHEESKEEGELHTKRVRHQEPKEGGEVHAKRLRHQEPKEGELHQKRSRHEQREEEGDLHEKRSRHQELKEGVELHAKRSRHEKPTEEGHLHEKRSRHQESKEGGEVQEKHLRHKERKEEGDLKEKRSRHEETKEDGHLKERRSRYQEREEEGDLKEKHLKHQESKEGGDLKEMRSRHQKSKEEGDLKEKRSRHEESKEEGHLKERRSRHEERKEEGDSKEKHLKHQEAKEEGDLKEKRSRHQKPKEEGKLHEKRTRCQESEDEGDEHEKRSRHHDRKEGDSHEKRSKHQKHSEDGELHAKRLRHQEPKEEGKLHEKRSRHLLESVEEDNLHEKRSSHYGSKGEGERRAHSHDVKEHHKHWWQRVARMFHDKHRMQHGFEHGNDCESRTVKQLARGIKEHLATTCKSSTDQNVITACKFAEEHHFLVKAWIGVKMPLWRTAAKVCERPARLHKSTELRHAPNHGINHAHQRKSKSLDTEELAVTSNVTQVHKLTRSDGKRFFQHKSNKGLHVRGPVVRISTSDSGEKHGRAGSTRSRVVVLTGEPLHLDQLQVAIEKLAHHFHQLQEKDQYSAETVGELQELQNQLTELAPDVPESATHLTEEEMETSVMVVKSLSHDAESKGRRPHFRISANPHQVKALEDGRHFRTSAKPTDEIVSGETEVAGVDGVDVERQDNNAEGAGENRASM